MKILRYASLAGALALCIVPAVARAVDITVQWTNSTSKRIVRESSFDRCGGVGTTCSVPSGIGAGKTANITATNSTGSNASIIYRYSAYFGTVKYSCQVMVNISQIDGVCGVGVYSIQGDVSSNGSKPECDQPQPEYSIPSSSACSVTVKMTMDD